MHEPLIMLLQLLWYWGR